MSHSFEDFVKDLTQCGLVAREDAEALCTAASQATVPLDGKRIAQLLVEQGRLTVYQAAMVCEGHAKGLVLGDYVVLDRLGQGGMGIVYKAEHRRMKRLVALKLLPHEVTGSADRIKRFQREVVAAAKLCHPNIVMALDAREDGGVHYLVTEYVNGCDLAAQVREHGRMSVTEAVDCILQAARGLDYAHSRGVIHRDIKPANLLQDKSGTVKILDMGLARLLSAEPSAENEEDRSRSLTESGVIMGTVDFMAPEQALDTHEADARSDLYSLGCTLYFLITAKLPFHEATSMKTLVAHREKAIPPLRAERGDVPIELDWILEKLLAKRPEARFQSASEFIGALEKCLAEAVVRPVLTDVAPASTRDWFASISAESPDENILTANEAELSASGPTVGGDGLPTTSDRLELPLGETASFAAGRSASSKHEASPTQPGRGHEWPGSIMRRLAFWVAAVVIAVGLTVLPQIVIRIRDKQGTETTISAPSDSSVTVQQSGKVLATIPPVPPAENYALEFDGKSSYVNIRTFDKQTFAKDTPRQPLTLEATVNLASRLDKDGRHVVSGFPLGLQQFTWERPFWRAFTRTTNRAHPYQDSVDEPELGRQTHLAVVYDGKDIRLFVNGQTQYRNTRQFTDGKERDARRDFELAHVTPLATIGASFFGAEGYKNYFHGIIDEVRLSKAARYRKDYTPSKRFEPDADTLALYHFDEGEGDVLYDSSGNGYDGTIVGAKWVKMDDEFHEIGCR